MDEGQNAPNTRPNSISISIYFTKPMEKFNSKSKSDPKNPFAYHLTFGTHNIKTKSSLKHNFSFLKMWDEWNLSAHTQITSLYTFHTTNEYFPTLEIFTRCFFFDGFPQLFHGICIYYIIRCITHIKCSVQLAIDPFKNILPSPFYLMLCIIWKFATTVCVYINVYQTQVYKPCVHRLKTYFWVEVWRPLTLCFWYTYTYSLTLVWNDGITFVC